MKQSKAKIRCSKPDELLLNRAVGLIKESASRAARLTKCAVAPHRTTEYEFDHFVHLVHSVEKLVAKNGLFANLALAADDVLIGR